MTSLDVVHDPGRWRVGTASGAVYVIESDAMVCTIDVLEAGASGGEPHLVNGARLRVVAADRVRPDGVREGGIRIGAPMHLVLETELPLGLAVFARTPIVLSVSVLPRPEQRHTHKVV